MKNTRFGWARALALVLTAALWAGCESWNRESPSGERRRRIGWRRRRSAGGGGGSSGGGGGGGSDAITGPITWLHTDVSSWPVTTSLSASVAGGTISMPYDKARAWPAVGGLNANPWVIVNYGGQWYAATFEYFRHGQTSKPVGVLNGALGDHIKVPPLNRWRPRSGERIGLMVSGLARAQQRNVRERSNIVMVTWP
jgi:hypothetical protein